MGAPRPAAHDKRRPLEDRGGIKGVRVRVKPRVVLVMAPVTLKIKKSNAFKLEVVSIEI